MNLDELERLEASATPGPWTTDDTYLCIPASPDLPDDGMYNVEYAADAALIAAARNALPRLLAVARACQAWRDEPYASNSSPEWIAVIDALDALRSEP